VIAWDRGEWDTHPIPGVHHYALFWSDHLPDVNGADPDANSPPRLPRLDCPDYGEGAPVGYLLGSSCNPWPWSTIASYESPLPPGPPTTMCASVSAPGAAPPGSVGVHDPIQYAALNANAVNRILLTSWMVLSSRVAIPHGNRTRGSRHLSPLPATISASTRSPSRSLNRPADPRPCESAPSAGVPPPRRRQAVNHRGGPAALRLASPSLDLGLGRPPGLALHIRCT